MQSWITQPIYQVGKEVYCLLCCELENGLVEDILSNRSDIFKTGHYWNKMLTVSRDMERSYLPPTSGNVAAAT